MKTKKLTKEALLKKYERMFGKFGKKAVEEIKDFDIDRIERIVNIAEMFRINIPSNKKDLDYNDFKKFPKHVQKEVILILAAYNKCNVSFEFGHWDITPDSCIRSSYGRDHKVFGTFYYDNLVNKVKNLKEKREKYLDDFRKIDVPDSWWA